MRRAARLSLVVGGCTVKSILLVIFLVGTRLATACVCVELTDRGEYASASTVVLVRITDTAFVARSGQRAFDWVRANFEVVKTYKGDASTLQYLKSEKVTCEVPLIPGDLYLVFSRGVEFETLSRCSRSRWINPQRVKDIERQLRE